MSKERLSKLQKVIIKMLQDWNDPITKKQVGFLPYRYLISAVGEETGKYNPMNPFTAILGGRKVPDGFTSTFSQSVRNLEKKGIVYLEGFRGIQEDMRYLKTMRVHLAKKGKSLNLNKYVKDKKSESKHEQHTIG